MVAIDMPRRTSSEYSAFGRTLNTQLVRRDIRSSAELARRIKAKGGYPRRLSDETIRNYLQGKHSVPAVFLQYAVMVMEDMELLSEAERAELEKTYTWGQQPEDSPITEENVQKGDEFVEQVEDELSAKRRKGEEDGGSGV